MGRKDAAFIIRHFCPADTSSVSSKDCIEWGNYPEVPEAKA